MKKKFLAMTLALAMLGSTMPVAAEGATLADYPMLENLDLDDTLQPGMYDGKKIVIACLGGTYAESLNIYADLFYEMTGGEVEVQSFPEDLGQKTQLGLQSNMFDVVCVTVALAHSYGNAGLVSDLTEMLDTIACPSYDEADFLPAMYETYTQYNGMKVALPFKPDSSIFHYRKDLFEDPVQQAAFKEKFGRDLTVPTTPEELIEVAQFFTRSMNPDSPVEYGFSGSLGEGDSLTLFYSLLGYYGGYRFDEEYNLGFTDGSGVETIETMQKLIECAPPESNTFDWTSGNVYFAEGNVAMEIQWPGLYMNCESDDSPNKGKMGYGLVPGGKPTLGGWVLSIASGSPEQEMAFKFCELVTSKDGEYIKAPIEMDPCRVSNYDREIFIELNNPVYDALRENLSRATQLVDPDIPYGGSEISGIEARAVFAALEGKITPEEAIEQMAEGMTEVIASVKDAL